MRIKELSLSTAFRYISASVSAWSYLAIFDWPTASSIIIWPFTVSNDIGAIALIASLLLIAGSLLYFLYRSLIFDSTIFLYIYDRVLRLLHRDNYRNWLRGKYNLKTRQSQALADLLGEKIKDRVSDGMARAFAGTHLLIIIGLVGIVECLIFWSNPLKWYVMGFACVCFVAGLRQNQKQEYFEMLQFKDAYFSDELDKIASKIDLSNLSG